MNYTHDNVLVAYAQLCRQSPILAQFVFARTLVGGAHDVSALIRAGGDVNGTDSDGTPHLITAFAHHKFQAARALIEGGADVDVVDSGLNSALILSVRYQAQACFAAVLCRGPNLEMQNDEGDRALHIAAGLPDDPSYLRALLAAGADPNACNRKGETPLNVAHRHLARANCAILAPHTVRSGSIVWLRRSGPSCV